MDFAHLFVNEQSAEMLWRAFAEKRDLAELIAVMDCDAPNNDDARWATEMNSFMRNVLDDILIDSIETFTELEDMIDQIMSILNIGLVVAPALIHIFRLVIVYGLTMIMDNGWGAMATAPPPEPGTEAAVEWNKIDRSVYSVAATATGLITVDITKWIAGASLPIVFYDKRIITEADIAENRIDLEVVQNLLNFLEDRGIISFGADPATAILAEA